MAYASNGNISTKSDLGPGTYTYGHATKPFAVTEINSGNQVIPSADQVATYNSFEQVSTIDEDDYHATFTYNSDNQRCKMLVTDLGSTVLTRWYVGSRYIKETEGSTTTEYTWIGGDAYSAPVVAEKVGSTTNYYYLLRDYLGNITHKVNTSNTVTAEYSYDAWGRRRDKDDWSYTLSSEPDLTADRGFTGHEYLAYFNIVNMNGRLYDPLVGRFLSPDENVQMPDFTQNFNRYSYCLNNPLVYTDPDGEWFFSLLSAVFPPAAPFLVAADVFLWSATFDYATQTITNYVTRQPGETFKDWAWKDIDWLDVGVSGVAGVATMGLDKVYKAGKIGKTLYRTGQVGINAGLPAISARYDWKPASDGDKFSVNKGDKFWTEYTYTVVKQYSATRATNNIIKHLYSDKPWILNNNPVKKQVLEGMFDLPASVGTGWWSKKYYDSRHVAPEPPQVPLLPGETPLPDNWWENMNNFAPNNQNIENNLRLNKF